MNWFVGGDQRAFWTVEYLEKQGIKLHTLDVPGRVDHVPGEKISLLLLPFPVEESMELSQEILNGICAQTLVIGGRMGKIKQLWEARGAKIRDLYDTEPLTTLNAVATVEGALALLIRESEITLWGSQCLVIGGGRIGMLLGERLRNLGARVTVSARSPGAFGRIRALGMETDMTGCYEKGLDQYDHIINTVPFPVLDRERLEEVKDSCLLLELASAPGGFSVDVCRELGRKALSAPGLPGKFSPKTAGYFYGEGILQTLKEEGRI